MPPPRPSGHRPRPAERRIRRRQIAVLLTLAAVVGGVLALTLAFRSSNEKPARPASPATTAPQSKTTSKREHKRQHVARQKLDAAADRAASRFAEIGLPLYCGAGKKKLVALTFDDGPSIYTERFLVPRLSRKHARATFFLLGRRIAEYPQAARKELALGAIGDHTWNHSMLTGLNRFAVKAQLGDTQKALQQATGKPVTLFRPPYGAHDAEVDRQVQSYGMLQVMWSVDSFDWKGFTWKAIVKQVLDAVEPGSIVLMHDIHPATMQALPVLLHSLHHRGFRLVSVPEMLALDPPSVEQLQQGIDGCKAQAAPSNSGA